MSDRPSEPNRQPRPRRSFLEDFRRFFTRGLAAVLPTLITLSILFWVLDFLWNSVGRHMIWGVKYLWIVLQPYGVIDERPAAYIRQFWSEDRFQTQLVGVLLAVVVVYIIGLFVGNLIGRTFWTLAERAVMKIPVIRAIYPAVKQVTDFLLQDKTQQFRGRRVVAVRMHHSDVWSIGLVTGSGPTTVSEAAEEETLNVFVPSSPASFSGYMVIAPKSAVVDLPITVEEAMRMLVSGGVVTALPPGTAGPTFPGGPDPHATALPPRSAASSAAAG